MAQNITVTLLPVPATIVGSAGDLEERLRARDSLAREVSRAMLRGDGPTASMLLAQFRGIESLV